MIRYPIRRPDGQVLAYHVREDTADGKRMWWELPDGSAGLGGMHATELPLFGSQHVAGWDTSRPVFITEGERDQLALANRGYRALGTVTGAPACHDIVTFRILAGFDVLLWPDRDRAGIEQMLKVARATEPVAASLLWLEWPDGPPGAGAADYLAAGLSVDELVTTAGRVPVPPPAMRPTSSGRRVPWRQVSLAPRGDVAPLSRAVRRAGRSNRNALLFWAARTAADDGIGQDVAEADLLDAFLADEPTPIREREGRATIRSAYRR